MNMLDTVDNALPCTADSSAIATSIPLPVRERLFQSDEINVEELPAAAEYLRTEFPSECWNSPHFATTVTGLLDRFFVNRLPVDPRMEHVYWDSEDDVLKVWVVTSESDFPLEEPIYKAQLAFIEQFPTFLCDFSVIYRYGKALAEVAPQGAHLLR